MSDFPFGFTPGGGGSGSGGAGGGSGSGAGGPADPFGFGAAGMPSFGDLQRFLSTSEGPVNWPLAEHLARQAAATDDPDVGGPRQREVAAAVDLAQLWLDEATVLPAGSAGGQSWSRTRWVEATLPAWKGLCDVVAARVNTALTASLGSAGGLGQLELPEDFEVPPEMAALLPPGFTFDRATLQNLLGSLQPMLGQVGALLFGAQVGQGLGALARGVLSSTEIGLPLGPVGTPALVTANVDAFSTDLEVPADEVLLFLALREAAAQRLFAAVPWLSPRLIGAVEEYARDITVDVEAIGRAVSNIDPTDPESLQRSLGDDLFAQEPSPAQQAALRRLDTLLALVEGWVEQVCHTAAAAHLPHADALRETMRRRRAAGGPAEQTFATLVGLELRPRRLREAAAYWAAIAEREGTTARERLWDHPDLLPDEDTLASGGQPAAAPSDLDDPLAAFAKLGDAPTEPAGDERTPGDTEGPGRDRPGDAGPGGG